MKNGDRERFEAFVRTSRRGMLRIARNLCRTSGVDPEDLVEEALERALRQLERGEGDPLALPFVTRVMTNQFIDICRHRQRTGDAPEKAAPEVQSGGEEEVVVDPEPVERWRNVPDAQVQQAVEALEPERLREVYRLHAGGLRYKQIARRLGIPEGTVGSDLSDARRQLRQRLGGRAE
jgi:RNA polymerase sigma-70 factor (ECF subfamily)